MSSSRISPSKKADDRLRNFCARLASHALSVTRIDFCDSAARLSFAFPLKSRVVYLANHDAITGNPNHSDRTPWFHKRPIRNDIQILSLKSRNSRGPQSGFCDPLITYVEIWVRSRALCR
jgi:hypothetical protein